MTCEVCGERIEKIAHASNYRRHGRCPTHIGDKKCNMRGCDLPRSFRKGVESPYCSIHAAAERRKRPQGEPKRSINREMRAHRDGEYTGGESGYIYLAHLYGDIYKIGKSAAPKKRLKSFRTASPDARLIHTAECADMDVAEKLAHNKFQRLHYRYETYQIPEECVELIIAEMDNISSVSPSDISNSDDFWDNFHFRPDRDVRDG